jgi:5-methylcytosine-specific restriction enzyme subunit McrC
MADIGSGAVAATGFTLRLFDVFERFVRVALRESAGLTTDEFPDSWRGGELTLAESGAVTLAPDLGVRGAEGWSFVGDVKYKRDPGDGNEADLYQLLAYATATGLSTATLIYADGPPNARSHVVRHTGVTLQLRRLDLSRSPHDVLEQVKRLAIDLGLSGRRG